LHPSDEASIGKLQCTNAFYIQSPRLQNTIPVSILEKLVVRMRAFPAKWEDIADFDIMFEPDAGVKVKGDEGYCSSLTFAPGETAGGTSVPLFGVSHERASQQLVVCIQFLLQGGEALSLPYPICGKGKNYDDQGNAYDY